MAICLLQFFILFLGCQANSDKLEKLVFNNNDFALKLYNKLIEQRQTNVIFSPLSISRGLVMTSLGAKDQTLKEIHSTIAGKFPKKQIHEMFQEIMRDVCRNETFAKIIEANKWYAQKGFDILSSFKTLSEKFYESRFQALDFRNETFAKIIEANEWYTQKGFDILPLFKKSSKKFYELGFHAVEFSNKKESTSSINNWMPEETDGILTEIVEPEDLTSPTKLVLVSTLNFKAQWNSAFKKGSTTFQTFHVTPHNSVGMPFLHFPLTAAFHGHFNKTLHYEILEIPFKSGEFRFGIILPDLKKTSLKQVETSLKADIFKSHGLTSLMANVLIPSFRVKSTFDLSDNLKKLGISNLFEKGKADLSSLERTKSLHVSKVLHKVSLEVDEEGAHTARTAFTTVRESVPKNSGVRINFRADHPFLFYIIDIGTGSLIYLGRYSASL